MVSIKSITILALATFAAASPLLAGGKKPVHGDQVASDNDFSGNGSGNEFDDDWLNESFNDSFEDNLNDNLNDNDVISPKQKDTNNGNDFRTMQNQHCGPQNQVISCCNSENGGKAEGGLLGAALGLEALNFKCSALSLPISVIGASALTGVKDEKCSNGQISCCQHGPVNKVNNGLVDVGDIKVFDCSPLRVF